MTLIDTHTHLYSDAFDTDRKEMVERAIENGVTYMLLPNIETDTVDIMHELCDTFPLNCFPMMGIHPCSIKEDYKQQLQTAETLLRQGKYIGVGEIGLDFFWEKTFIPQQEEAFIRQCSWARELDLPVSIHSRNATYRCIELLKKPELKGVRGIFHCFSGSVEEATEIIKLGFYLGIGGVLTYKNAHLSETLKHFTLQNMVLETDAPYLPPVPHRGQRNESAYVKLVAQKLAETFNTSLEEVAETTTKNALTIFNTLHTH